MINKNKNSNVYGVELSINDFLLKMLIFTDFFLLFQ